MELTHLIAKEKGGRYYVHESATPKKPIPGSFGDKKHALRFAAKCMGISYKEYLKLRKENPSE